MHSTIRGWDQDLFILPFDHRGSFSEKLFGIRGRPPTPQETSQITSYKRVIYRAFQMALSRGLGPAKAGVLVDEQYGSEILLAAKRRGLTTACPAEKSGQAEFDFEYGDQFAAHIQKFEPTFVKALVRWDPQGDRELNQRQSERLRELSDFCRESPSRLMLELLVPHDSPEQLGELLVQSICSLQDSGVEPDLWKLEGLSAPSAALSVLSQAQKGSQRAKVGVILLGKGEPMEKVREWLTTAARIPGMRGFAIGRTLFWEPLLLLKQGVLRADQASEKICESYLSLCELWERSRASEAQRRNRSTA